MKKLFITLLGMAYLVYVALGQNSIMIKPDYRKLISRADLIYQKPVKNSEAGQPIGNGRMGTLVWTTPQSLRFQMNRVDIFGNNSATSNFYQRHSDYCGGAGFIDIDFQGDEDIFTDSTFRQHLSCYDGMVTTEGKNVKTTAFVWSNEDVMVVRIEDSRSTPFPVAVNLRALRDPVARRGDHSAISKVRVLGKRIVLTQEFSEGDYLNRSALVISLSGNNSRAWVANDSEVKLSSFPGQRDFTIYVSGAATFDREVDIVAVAMRQLDSAESIGYEKTAESSKHWWHTLWEKSFVELNSEDGEADFVEQHYTYYLYLMGSTSRGEYPVKFNGMLWTTGGDRRQWGGMYWGANQSCLYDALFAANRIDLLAPMFSMYSKMIPSCEMAARQVWGSKGIYIPETVGFDGPPLLPEDIASQMRSLYLQNKPHISNSTEFREFLEYASKRQPHSSLWNWKADAGWKEGEWHFTDKGQGFAGNVMHLFSRGAKLAYLYWMRYEYTRDEKWLSENAYPVIKGVAEFYRNYPNLRKTEDGKYHIYHVNDNESVWCGHNTGEEISSMMGILPVAIKSSEILGVDAEMRLVWREFLENLSPLPLSSDHAELAGQPVTFVRSLKPALQGPVTGRPDGNTMPQWCFDFITLESGNDKLMKIANNTYDAYYPGGIDKDSDVGILSMLPVAGTLLGRKEVTQFLIPNQIRLSDNDVMENRMHLREGAQTTTAQRLGRSAHALNNALCQSNPSQPGEASVIRVFPAWPDHWNARFNLLCRGNFLVSSSFQNERVEFVEIKSMSGGICRIRNPWNNDAILYVDGKENKILKGSLFEFPTHVNTYYTIVKKGTVPDQYKHNYQNVRE